MYKHYFLIAAASLYMSCMVSCQKQQPMQTGYPQAEWKPATT